jgi:hypothetical protein
MYRYTKTFNVSWINKCIASRYFKCPEKTNMNPIQHNNIMYCYIKHSMCRERTSALLDVTLNALKNNMNFILFSYLMIVGAIDWNICPGNDQRANVPVHLHLKPLNNRNRVQRLTRVGAIDAKCRILHSAIVHQECNRSTGPF